MSRSVQYAATNKNRRHLICYTAVALSLGAAIIHAWMMPEHFQEWWGYGAFFLITTIAQGVYGFALLRLVWRWLFPIGIAGNLAIIGLLIRDNAHLRNSFVWSSCWRG